MFDYLKDNCKMSTIPTAGCLFIHFSAFSLSQSSTLWFQFWHDTNLSFASDALLNLQLGHKSQLFLCSFQLRYPTSSIGLKRAHSSILWESMSDKSYANPNTTSWVWLSSTSLLRSATRFSMLVSVELSMNTMIRSPFD